MAERDGRHDFDFELGRWKMHLRRRLHPLTGSDNWLAFGADSVTRKVWGGRAQLEEFEADSPPHTEALTLRLYDPQSRQWRLYWATSKDGALGQPMIGEFRNGEGEFFDQELYQGKAIYVRYVWTNIPPDRAHFEQSFSADGGKTWEANWITDDVRVKDVSAGTSTSRVPARGVSPAAEGAAQRAGAGEDGQHDFDFEFGTWKAHLRRLLHPLSGSHEWVEYEGTSTVRKIWNGHANLGELEVGNASTHIEGLSLRLFNPQSHQWNVYWSSSSDGVLGAPMVGGFNYGRGEFYDQELFNGKAVFVRFVFSDITPDSFHFEQSFSADGGKTWEPNWTA
ncbi:MAG: hypothetical protein ACM3PW_14290, partial [Chlamydiota bacterium]